MWFELKAKLKATQRDRQVMQIHQEPLFNHRVAHADAEIILLAAQAEFATIQHIQVDWKLTPPDPGHEGPPSEPCNKKLPDSQVLQDLIEEDQSPRYDEYADSDWYNMEDALHSLC